MNKVLTILLAGLMLCAIGCTPLEKSAYRTIVASKAFLDASKAQHPECVADPSSNVCSALAKATHAKDFMIDAAETYCSGPSFETGGVCQPPAKGTSAADQAIAKLKAAIAGYNQAASDLKGVL